MANLANVSDNDFNTTVLESGKTVVVDFWAEWCGPCKVLGPILEQAAGEVPDVSVVKMNVEENMETPVQYGVRNIPTLVAFKNGEAISVLVGLREKNEIVDWLKANA